ncbi:MAG: glycosyltransferase family 2 protein [Lachnospiraceae bacterium]|nr:glycosyltransferase family 2 protein [Lachnospiraceae bacterium]
MDCTKDKLVSIIVPVYNVEKFIEDTIECVRAQTYQSWELLLVEDVSKDSTRKVIETYLHDKPDGRIRLICQPENKGAAHARNRGLKEATGRFIAYLDADDLWEPEKLEKQIAFMEEKEAAFSFTGYEFADEEGRGLGKIVQVPEVLSYKEALKNTTIFTTTVMFDTDRIDKNMLEMPIIKSEDTALWWKVLRNGFTAYGLNENLVKYRRAGKSLSSNKLEAVRRIWNLYRKAEGMNVFSSAYHFCFWAVRAVMRRI